MNAQSTIASTVCDSNLSLLTPCLHYVLPYPLRGGPVRTSEARRLVLIVKMTQGSQYLEIDIAYLEVFNIFLNLLDPSGDV